MRISKRRLRMAVLFGGRSVEHEISLLSAEAILKNADKRKYRLVPIGITKRGEWKIFTGRGRVSPKAFFSSPRLAPVYFGDPPLKGAVALVSGRPKRIPLDVVFPVLHGAFGEDGTVQGLLELSDLPCVGSGVLGSAAGMDKPTMKRLFEHRGIPVARWFSFTRAEWKKTASPLEARARRLGYPVFVKPASQGSSVGITRAASVAALRRAVRLALRFDGVVVVEKAHTIRDVEASVLEEPGGAVRVSAPGEILPANEFYDYESKYLKESELRIPAKLPKAVEREVRRLAREAFLAVGASGYARVDFLVERRTPRACQGEGKRRLVLVNEINTIPGFTAISMFPRLWEAEGLSFGRLIDVLVKTALRRHEEKSRLQTDFSRYLSHLP
jgi:D-alanine-D-alanine ligase